MRPALVALCFWAIAISTASADTVYRNSEWGFEISTPEGWAEAPPLLARPDTVRVVFAGPNRSQTGAQCHVTVMDAPGIAKLSQAQINSAVGQGIMDSTLLNEVRGMDPQARIVASRIVKLQELTARQTEISAVIPGSMIGGTALPARQLDLALSVPGRTYIVVCTAMEKSFETLSPTFEKIQRSLKIVRK